MLGRSIEELTLKLQQKLQDKFTRETTILQNKKFYLVKHKNSDWSCICKTAKEVRRESMDYYQKWRKK